MTAGESKRRVTCSGRCSQSQPHSQTRSLRHRRCGQHSAAPVSST